MGLTLKDLEGELRASKEFFDRSTRTLAEEDSGYAPIGGVMTVCQQVAHVAQTIDWFIDGAFSASGFDLDFEKHCRERSQVTSLNEARKSVERSFSRLFETLSSTPLSEWEKQMAPGPVMGGEPRKSIFLGIIEHTAHHRGALTVYARMLGKVPPLPYMDL